MQVRRRVWVGGCTRACVYVYVCVCTHVYIYIIHIYIYMRPVLLHNFCSYLLFFLRFYDTKVNISIHLSIPTHMPISERGKAALPNNGRDLHVLSIPLRKSLWALSRVSQPKSCDRCQAVLQSADLLAQKVSSTARSAHAPNKTESQATSCACRAGLLPGPSAKVVQAKPSESRPAFLKRSALSADGKCPRCFAP